MRAVVKTKEAVGIEILDMPKPKIKPNQVLLQVKGCGICGSDLGLYDWTPESRTRRGKPIKLPVIIGHEPAGIVAEVGSEVSQNLKVGDRVAADSWGGCGECYFCRLGKFNMCERSSNIGSLTNGGYAEYVAMPGFNLYKLPDAISMDVAPILQPLGVAVHAMEVTDLRLGDEVVVLGPGAIGIMEAMVAKCRGATRVWITGIGKDKQRLELARKLGFETVNIEEQSVVDVVREATGGLGVAVVFDATARGAGDEKVKLLKKGGQLTITVEDAPSLTFNGADFRRVGDITIRHHVGRNPTTFYSALNLLASGRIDVRSLITHMPLEEADKAFQMLKRSEAAKIILVP